MIRVDHTSVPRSRAPRSRLRLPSNDVSPGAPWHALHHTLGNHGVEQLLHTHVIQAKLRVDQPNDPYEQEADRVAEQVLAAPADSAVGRTPARVQRVTRHLSAGPLTAPPTADHVLPGSSSPLNPVLRQDMEQHFGHDFSQVHVHTGRAADRSARAVDAKAYTVGRNIVFGAGRFAPETYEGRRLIAHELTHVVQQSGSHGTLQRDGLDSATALEDVPELGADWEEGLLEVMSHKEDPEVLAIEIEGELLNAGEDVYAALYARLSPKNLSARDKLAVRFNRTFKGRIRKRLLKRFKEVAQEYKPTAPDPFAHLAPGVAPGREARTVHELGRIDALRGVHLRGQPGTPTDDAPILPFDTLVSIESKTVEKKGQQSWLYVVALGKDAAGRNVTGTGFVEEYFVARKPPEPGAHLYQVKPGDMLKDIAENFYRHGFAWGNDARVYVQAIYHANKDRDVVFRQKPDLTVDRRALETKSLSQALELWRTARVVEGLALWVPSNAFVQRLKAAGVINQASISKAMWDAAVGAFQALIDWAKYTAGFVIGLLEGAWNALADLFTGIIDLIKAIGGIIKALFWDWDELKAFGSKLAKLWENKEQIWDAIVADFTRKWENQDDYDRGNFQGEVLGYIMMTAFITLVTFGAGAAIAGSGRLATFIKLIQLADKAGDITFYAGKLVKAVKLPGKVIDKAHDALADRVVSKALSVEPSAPHIDTPHIDTPHVEAPDVETPHVEAPDVDAPHVDAPHADAPHADAPQGGSARTVEPAKPSEPFDLTRVGAKAEAAQLLDMAKFTDVKLKPGQSALYILRDAADGTILKAGKTSAKAAKNRFSVYQRAGKKMAMELRLEIYPLEKSATKAEHFEKALRAQLESAGHHLPWDNTGGRLGRPGFGTPGEGVRTPPITKGEMNELLTEHKGSLAEVGKELRVHRRTADMWAKALGLWPKDFK